jgi:hypothetical protein
MAKTTVKKKSVKTAAKSILKAKTAAKTATKTPAKNIPPKAAKKVATSAPKAAKENLRSAPGKPASTQPVALADRLDTLLHTVRCIAQHEDELCTLLHAARKSNRLAKSLASELRAILANLPAEEYAWELRALEEELDAAA